LYPSVVTPYINMYVFLSVIYLLVCVGAGLHVMPSVSWSAEVSVK